MFAERRPTRGTSRQPGAGLARALSKLGVCSRSQARELIRAGRVTVSGAVACDPDQPVSPARDRIELDGKCVRPEAKVYLMLNKPRGLVTTASDERGRATVFRCFEGVHLPFLSPVGRLDQASEGLLLFTNDTAWAARITDPDGHVEKVYHVQIDCVADAPLLRRLQAGVTEEGEVLAARRARLLKHGTRNSWIEIVLDAGRNRHIRRMLSAPGINVLRLVRVAIGPVQLGGVLKGQWRHLTLEEANSLAPSGGRKHSERPAA